jgi:hypothetical protein
MATAKTVTYEVYQPTVCGRERIMTGSALSRHRTPEAAQAMIDRDNRRLRRQPGQANSWLDYQIRAIAGGHPRELNDGERERIIGLQASEGAR